MITPWLEVPHDSEFSIHNLPFGVVSIDNNNKHCDTPFCATRLGDHVLHLGILEEAGLLPTMNAFQHETTLNAFLENPKSVWLATRQRLQELLSTESNELEHNKALVQASIYNVQQVTQYHLPVTVGDYTDFYSSRYHAETVSELFRGNRQLTTQWQRLPVGYHGRASTVVATDTPIRRPHGQVAFETSSSTYQASEQLDYELEVAAVLGGGEDEVCVFGLVLMNDWSARDLQRFEYVPLGPFTGKNFGTTISPWIVMTEALATTPRVEIPVDPLDYLKTKDDDTIFDIDLMATLETPAGTKKVLTQTNYKYLFWTPDQQLAHHAVSGCLMKPGDLLGSGTISGPDGAGGSLLELSRNGTTPVKIDEQTSRTFLQDGDTVVLRGVSHRSDGTRVGFGECRGTVLASSSPPPKVRDPTPRYTNLVLYGWKLSSATWRVRLVLAAKGIDYSEVPVNLNEKEQLLPEFKARNPLGQVPVLEMTDTRNGEKIHLAQSLAIIKFLESAFPETRRVWPQQPVQCSLATELVEMVNAGTQPLQNVAYLASLEAQSEGKLNAFDLGKLANEKGLHALEARVKQLQRAGPFCLGTFSPTIADFCMVPQLDNARNRYKLDVDALFPTLNAICAACTKHSWFAKAQFCRDKVYSE